MLLGGDSAKNTVDLMLAEIDGLFEKKEVQDSVENVILAEPLPLEPSHEFRFQSRSFSNWNRFLTDLLEMQESVREISTDHRVAFMHVEKREREIGELVRKGVFRRSVKNLDLALNELDRSNEADRLRNKMMSNLSQSPFEDIKAALHELTEKQQELAKTLECIVIERKPIISRAIDTIQERIDCLEELLEPPEERRPA
jgi:hypothetical protein